MMSKRVATTLVLLLLPVLCLGRTWHVEKDGSGDFTVIQDAVDAAASGDTILIGPGRFDDYSPHVIAGQSYNMHVFVSGKDLVVSGAGKDQTIIGMETDAHDLITYCIATNYGTVTVEQLTVSNAEYGIDVAYGSGTISQCRITGAMFGVYPDVSSQCDIDHCEFVGNRFGIWHYSAAGHAAVQGCSFTSDVSSSTGIVCQSLSGTGAYECTFTGLTFGVQYSFHATGRIEGCVFEDCSYAPVDITDGSTLEIVDCEMEGGVYCIYAEREGNFSGSGNTLNGGETAVIRAEGAIDNPDITFTNNVLRHAPDGLLVQLGFFNYPPLKHLDFTHNDWGYTDADSIAALIWDGSDDPSIYGVVGFEPFNTPGERGEELG